MPFVHKFALTYKSQENIFYAENTGRRPHGKSCNHIPAVSYSQSKTFASLIQKKMEDRVDFLQKETSRLNLNIQSLNKKIILLNEEKLEEHDKN